MTTANASAYGRNFDGKPGDVLERLRQVVEGTPVYSHVTRPVNRSLLAAAVTEIERLRMENAELLQKEIQKEKGDQQ